MKFKTHLKILYFFWKAFFFSLFKSTHNNVCYMQIYIYWKKKYKKKNRNQKPDGSGDKKPDWENNSDTNWTTHGVILDTRGGRHHKG